MHTNPIKPGTIVECVDPIPPLIRGQLYLVLGNSYGVGGWAVHVREAKGASHPAGNRYGWWPWRFRHSGIPHRLTNDRWMQDAEHSADPASPDQSPEGD